MKRFLLVFVTLLNVAVSYAQPSQNIPSGNLDAWYPFCSTFDVMDRTMSGYDLISSSVSPAPDRFLNPSKAYTFNGVNSELHYSTFFPIPAFGIQEFTYSCHINPTVVQDAIIMYNGNPSLDGIGLIINNGVFGGGPGNEVSILFGGVAQSPSFPLLLNQWHHLLVRRNGNSYVLFVDGVQEVVYIPVGLPTSGYNPPTTVFQVGFDFTGADQAFTGQIDDIAIYSRQVTNAEVLRLRNFNPNIVFSLGPDINTPLDTISIGGGPFGDPNLDTTLYPNALFPPASPNKYTYAWSTLAANSNIKVGFPPGLPTPPAVRTLRISRLYNCELTDLINITHIVAHVNLGADQNICVGDTVILGETAVPGVSYLWNTGDTSSKIIVATSGTYWLRKDSAVTTGSVTSHYYGRDSINVIVSAPTYVTLQNDTVTCQGQPVVLKSSNSYTAPVYTWSDGITTTPTLNVTTSGLYWLIVNDGACSDTDSVNVFIVYDTLTVYNPDTAICKGGSVIARASASADITYQWIPTSGIPVSSIPTPTITPDTSAYYILEGTILVPGTGFGCRVKDSFYIDVQPIPKVNLGGNRSVCQFDSIRITPVVTPRWYTRYSYDWTPGTYLDDSTAPYAVYTAGDTTKLILIVTTPAGCKSSDSIIIFKYNGNFASMSRDTFLCPGDSVQLMPFSTEPGITTYSWYPATYLSNATIANPIIKPINKISYKGIATSQYGCLDTLSYDIDVFPAAVVYLVDSVVLFPGESYQIMPGSNCSRFSWTPPIGLNDTNISNPMAMPPVSTRYIVTARTEDGCRTMDSINVRVVAESIITVPNAFAPGSYNSNIKVILRGLARLRYFRIFNRWGTLVFESTNIEESWDGTFNGAPQPAGVYVYEAEAATSQGKILHKQGNITLLK